METQVITTFICSALCPPRIIIKHSSTVLSKEMAESLFSLTLSPSLYIFNAELTLTNPLNLLTFVFSDPMQAGFSTAEARLA